MHTTTLSTAIGAIDDTLIAETAALRQQPKATVQTHKRRLIPALAVCLAACLCIILLYRAQTRLPLSEGSYGVTAHYTNHASPSMAEACLIGLTEEELFSYFNTIVVKGVVTKIDNIVLDFNGRKNYRAIAEIQVEQVYRGDCSVGDTISVLLPCPIVPSYQISTCETISEMRVGTIGIFMPQIYEADAYREENGARLLLKDLADYGFADGSRYAFLETEQGLVFDRYAYPSLTNAQTLADIEAYCLRMLQE